MRLGLRGVLRLDGRHELQGGDARALVAGPRADGVGAARADRLRQRTLTIKP